MEIEMKSLAIGVDNFAKLINQGSYYVDKTLMIKDLIDSGTEVNLFTRPRRFGKSLNISMLQYYFDNLKKDEAEVFNNLNIMSAGDKYREHQNKYPVIKLTLKGTGKTNFNDAFEKLRIRIAGEYERHKYLLSSLGIEHKELYQRLLSQKASVNEYSGSLKFLSECLEKYYDEKVIILIDEYDVPLEKAYFGGYYDEMIDFIRSFFDDALKTNDTLKFAVITGCLRVSKESIFTGLNNLNIVSIISNEYGEYFGFTELEMSNALTYYGIEEKRQEAQDWYNGYLFGDTTVYNPWSSIKYLNDVLNREPFPKPHWSNTSSNSIIRELIAIADDEARDEIESLIQGKSIIKPINEDIVYADITQNMDNLWNFLFFTGYLKKTYKKQIGVENCFELTIPNNEILYIYKRQIREWFDQRVKEVDMSNLYTAVLTQDVTTFEDEINEMLVETISYMDSHENFYHGFLTGVLRGIKGYIAKSNRESGNGRSDIFLRPVSIRKPAIVIEVKIAEDAKKLEQKCDEALEQIQEKKYHEELENAGYKEIIKYGIAFFRKDCMIKISEN